MSETAQFALLFVAASAILGVFGVIAVRRLIQRLRDIDRNSN